MGTRAESGDHRLPSQRPLPLSCSYHQAKLFDTHSVVFGQDCHERAELQLSSSQICLNAVVNTLEYRVLAVHTSLAILESGEVPP